MSLNYISLKILIIYLSILKSLCIPENISKKNSSISLNYTSYFINSTIRTLSDKNFDNLIKLDKSYSSDFLILFTLRRCPNCNQIMRIVENIEKKYSQKNKNLKFYKVDCFASHMTAMRFDIYKVPAYIYITKGYYALNYPEEKTEEELINFIEKENKDFFKYPGKIGYFKVCLKVIHHVTLKIKNKFPFWNDYLTFMFLAIIFLAFLYFEFRIYKMGCCDNKKKEQIKQKKNKEKKENDNSHNSKDGKINKNQYKEDDINNKLKEE